MNTCTSKQGLSACKDSRIKPLAFLLALTQGILCENLLGLVPQRWEKRQVAERIGAPDRQDRTVTALHVVLVPVGSILYTNSAILPRRIHTPILLYTKYILLLAEYNNNNLEAATDLDQYKLRLYGRNLDSNLFWSFFWCVGILYA